MLRIGLIGCGAWGKYILRDLKQLGCEVWVVARSERSQNHARSFGADKIVNNVNNLDGLAACVIATPTEIRYEYCATLLNKFPTIPLFVEKPLSNNLVEAQTLFALPNSQNIFVMDKWRYHAGVLKMASIAKEGVLGKIMGLQLTRVSWGLIHEDSNTVWHLMPHDIAIAYEILGVFPKPIYAQKDITKGQIRGMKANLLTEKDDIWVHIEVSDRSPVRKREIKLIGEDGIAILGDSYQNTITIYDTNKTDREVTNSQKEIEFVANMPLYDELAAFVGYVKKELPPPKSNIQEAIQNVAIIDQLLKM
jgi:predicted dehydrogenase